MTRDECVKMLRDHICVVTFTKRDGTERVMRCTLKSDHLPENSSTESSQEVLTQHKPVRKISTNMVSVWDMDKNAWRGFLLETIKNIKQES